MSVQERNEDYDSEPVRYCAKCYSLKVKYEEALDSECCAECGCTDILEAPIDEWEKKYERRYGHKFAVKEEDPKKTFIFRLSTEELKTRIYQSAAWRDIIKSFYPSFPSGWGKADSILLFFDTIVKQGRLNELKLFLFKRFKY